MKEQNGNSEAERDTRGSDGRDCYETLWDLERTDPRFLEKWERGGMVANASFNAFISTLTHLSGKHIHLAFKPGRKDLHRIHERAERLASKRQGRSFFRDLYFEDFGDLQGWQRFWSGASQFLLHRGEREEIFSKLGGKVIISLDLRGRILSSGSMNYGRFCRIVRTLRDYKAGDPERLDKYQEGTFRRSGPSPIFFHMQGTVPEKEILTSLRVKTAGKNGSHTDTT